MRSTPAADFLTHTRVDIYDYDFASADDLIGACTLTFGSISFNATERVFTCPPTDTTPGCRLRLRFVRPS